MPSRPCGPDCACGRHRKSREAVEKMVATRKARGLRPPACTRQPDCSCGRHWERTDEHREDQRRKMTGRKITWSDRIADTLRGSYRGGVAAGRSVGRDGYVSLTGSTHPLAHRGTVREHRAVLYDAIGPGSHPCFWCGEEVAWGTDDREGGLHVDHLNFDRQDNRPENLVPSCLSCNFQRRSDR